jgi:ring-1,2-phenylacetyl-CoA epoxidase subunit PaaE
MTASSPRRKKGWMNLTVTRIQEETWDTKTFYLEDAEEGGCPFDYVAGQYLTLRFDKIADKAVARSYTMSSSPVQSGFSALTIKRVEGGLVSNWMCDHLKVGDQVKALGPIGKFCYDPKIFRSHLIMLGAGSGVTPFVSMVRQYAETLGQEGSPKAMTLLVAYRSKLDLICWDELLRLNTYPGVRIIATLTREDARTEGFLHGRPDDEMYAEVLDGTYGEASYMTCGPEAMMEQFASYLQGKGVADEHIHRESFGN